MIKGLSRGGLLCPTQDVIGIVLVCYSLSRNSPKVISFYTFSQRKLAVNTCLAVLDEALMMNSGLANFCATHIEQAIR